MNDLQSKLKTKSDSLEDKNFKNQIFDEESLDDSLVRNIDTEFVSNTTERILMKTSNCPIHGHDDSLKCKHDDQNDSNESKRNVFDIVDADFIKRMIPFMHPSRREHTFRYFFDKVHEVVESVGADKLLDDDVLDIMQFRMGGSYLTELKDLRKNDTELAAIEDFFLAKDIEMEENPMVYKTANCPIHGHDNTLRCKHDYDDSMEKKRSVFDFIDPDFIKRMIPFMHPSSRNHTFRYFFDKVHEVVLSVGADKLLDDDVLDIIQFRMGGSYLTEIKDLRQKDTELAAIEEFFLAKDIERDDDSNRRQQLLSQETEVCIFKSYQKLLIFFQIEDDICLKRQTMSEMWGVNLSYSYTNDMGLLLILSRLYNVLFSLGCIM